MVLIFLLTLISFTSFFAYAPQQIASSDNKRIVKVTGRLVSVKTIGKAVPRTPVNILYDYVSSDLSKPLQLITGEKTETNENGEFVIHVNVVERIQYYLEISHEGKFYDISLDPLKNNGLGDVVIPDGNLAQWIQFAMLKDKRLYMNARQ